ncbi:MAG: LysM domain-containing protein [Rhodobacteraceae bacterium]|nr:LysM domain-containing protein [Paracoccaceae bacterium]MCY4326295.1 LysM domain-containing protein [Paracoccaceae bacterium]
MRDPIVITIQPGESLSRMAAQHGVSVEDLQRWNAIGNPDLIRIGQEIVVHIPPPTPETSPTATPLHSEKGTDPDSVGATDLSDLIVIGAIVGGLLLLLLWGTHRQILSPPRVSPTRPSQPVPASPPPAIMGNVVSVLN